MPKCNKQAEYDSQSVAVTVGWWLLRSIRLAAIVE
jgi:hypothetical protein